MTCPHGGCETEDMVPIKGQRRVTTKTLWLCGACRGPVTRPAPSSRTHRSRKTNRRR